MQDNNEAKSYSALEVIDNVYPVRVLCFCCDFSQMMWNSPSKTISEPTTGQLGQELLLGLSTRSPNSQKATNFGTLVAGTYNTHTIPPHLLKTCISQPPFIGSACVPCKCFSNIPRFPLSVELNSPRLATLSPSKPSPNFKLSTPRLFGCKPSMLRVCASFKSATGAPRTNINVPGFCSLLSTVVSPFGRVLEFRQGDVMDLTASKFTCCVLPLLPCRLCAHVFWCWLRIRVCRGNAGSHQLQHQRQLFVCAAGQGGWVVCQNSVGILRRHLQCPELLEYNYRSSVQFCGDGGLLGIVPKILIGFPFWCVVSLWFFPLFLHFKISKLNFVIFLFFLLSGCHWFPIRLMQFSDELESQAKERSEQLNLGTLLLAKLASIGGTISNGKALAAQPCDFDI